MRIISTYHDYYDCLMDGSDPHIWQRKNEILNVEKDLFYQKASNFSWYDGWGHTSDFCDWKAFYRGENVVIHTLELMILLFCEKIYPLWKFDNYVGYDYSSLCKQRLKLYPKWEKWAEKYRWGSDAYEEFWDNEFLPNLKVLNRKYKVPVILIREQSQNTEMECNPCLKNIQFYQVMDMNSCFQELERYIFNDLLEPEVESPPLADKLKAQAHGFTDKCSFRREPRKK